MARYTVHLHDRLCRVMDREAPLALAPVRKTAGRGRVAGMSRKARRRLLLSLAMVARCDPCVFVTLTYRDCVEDSERYRKDFNWYGVELRRRFPHCCGFWRLQFQERGAAHFHLLLWLGSSESEDEVNSWSSELWCRITGDNSPAHREHGSKTVDCGPNFRATGFYLALYQGRDEQDRTDIHTGRTWGIIGRKFLDLSPLVKTEMTDQDAIRFHRVLRGHYKSRNRETCARSGWFKGLRQRRTTLQAFLPVEVSSRLVQWVCSQPTDDPTEDRTTWHPQKLSDGWQW